MFCCFYFFPYQFSSVQSLSHVTLFATPLIAVGQVSLSITISRSSLKLMSIEWVMPSSHLILCRPLFLPLPIPPSIRVFSNESTLCMMWPKYWSFSFSIIPSKEHWGLISFRMDIQPQQSNSKRDLPWVVCKGWSPLEFSLSLTSKFLSLSAYNCYFLNTLYTSFFPCNCSFCPNLQEFFSMCSQYTHTCMRTHTHTHRLTNWLCPWTSQAN